MAGSTFEELYGRLHSRGTAHYPLALRTYARKLGLKIEDFGMLVLLFSYRWTPRDPFPSVHQFAEMFADSRGGLQHILRRLSEKGLVEIEHRRRTRGGSTSNIYHLQPLFDTLLALMDAENEAADKALAESVPVVVTERRKISDEAPLQQSLFAGNLSDGGGSPVSPPGQPVSPPGQPVSPPGQPVSPMDLDSWELDQYEAESGEGESSSSQKIIHIQDSDLLALAFEICDRVRSAHGRANDVRRELAARIAGTPANLDQIRRAARRACGGLGSEEPIDAFWSTFAAHLAIETSERRISGGN